MFCLHDVPISDTLTPVENEYINSFLHTNFFIGQTIGLKQTKTDRF